VCHLGCHLGASVTHLPWGYTPLWSPAKSGMGPSASQNGPFWRSEMPCGHGNWIKLLLGAHPRLCSELEGFFFFIFSRSQCVPFKFSMGSQYVAQVPNVFPNIFSIASHFNPIPSSSWRLKKHRAWVVGAAIIISPGASPLLPYNCCSFKSAPALLLHLFLPPQEAKLLACASLAIFSYCPSGLRGSFTTSSLYLVTVHPDSGEASFFLYIILVWTPCIMHRCVISTMFGWCFWFFKKTFFFKQPLVPPTLALVLRISQFGSLTRQAPPGRSFTFPTPVL
jgi:hypothetical protein